MRAWGLGAVAFVTLFALACSDPPPPGDAGGGNDGGGGSDAGYVGAPHPPFPILPRRGGSQIDAPRLVIVVATGEPLASSLFDFGDALLASTWLGETASEYGFAAPASATSLHVTGPAMPASVGLGALRQYVADLAAAQPELAPDGHTIYAVFYPPGTSFPNDCGFVGEHWALSAGAPVGVSTDGIAFIQRCGFASGDTELDNLTEIASHEIVETISDARPPTGYAMPSVHTMVSGGLPPWSISAWSYFQGGSVENADLCEGSRYHEGGFVYQRSWSLAAAAAGGDPCVPALAEPYYSASAASDWITVPAGTTTMVPITGWATGPRGDWSVTVMRTNWAGDLGASFGATNTVRIHDGQVQMLSISAPMIPGQFAVFRLRSSPNGYVATSGGGTELPVPASGDIWHDWIFGVHTTCATCPTPPASCGDGTCDAPMMESCASCPDDCGVCGAQCGPSNFTTACGSTFCPAHSTCAAGVCTCDMGFTASACDGTACPGGGCTYPDFWCTPTACGAGNWGTDCGSTTCPNDGQCVAGGRCSCPEGTQVATCDGRPCAGACSYPDYWCAVCGVANFTVHCSAGTCPSFSVCNADGTCSCADGYSARSCDGEYCDGTNCPYPGWWCVAEGL